MDRQSVKSLCFLVILSGLLGLWPRFDFDTPSAYALAYPLRTKKSIKLTVTTTIIRLSDATGLVNTEYGNCSNIITVRGGIPVCTSGAAGYPDAGIDPCAVADVIICDPSANSACDTRLFVQDSPANQILLRAAYNDAGPATVYIGAMGGCK